jgi:nucleoside-diphosphate-sugar epimerase
LLTRRPILDGQNGVRVLPGPWSVAALRDVIVEESITGIVNLAAAGVRPDAGEIAALYQTNVALPVSLIRAGADHIRSFVNIGSGAEYAGGPEPLDETAALSLTHPYGMSKAASGLAALQVARETGCGFAHLRLFGAYGEHEAAHRLLPTLITRLSRREIVPLSDGLQTRDWLYEADIADAIVQAIAMLDVGTLPSGLYNLGSGVGITVRIFAEMVADRVGASRDFLGFGQILRRGKEVDTLVANTALFGDETRWHPAYDLGSGLDEAILRYLSAT